MAVYNDSKFHMWRACIGCIWIDGRVDLDERMWIEEKIKNLDFTNEQKEILKNDLESNVNMEEVLEKITDQKDRAFLAHQIRVIGNLDSNFSSDEKKLLEKWNKKVLEKVNLDYYNKLIEEDEKASYHEDEVYKVHNKHSIFEAIHREIQRFLNPGDYKFPE